MPSEPTILCCWSECPGRCWSWETRREWVRAEDEMMKCGKEAQRLARMSGLGLVHKGRFFE